MYLHTLPDTETASPAFWGQGLGEPVPYPMMSSSASIYVQGQQLTAQVTPQQQYGHQPYFPPVTLHPRDLCPMMGVPTSRPVPDARNHIAPATVNHRATDPSIAFPNFQTRRPRYQDMVEVYNADTFIKKVPIKLLIRFSKKAAETFPRRTTVPLPKTCYDAPKPHRTIDPATGRPTSKRMYLNVDAPENPTHLAVGTVIKWMFDNEYTPREETLVAYGPPRLQEIDLVSLIDLYQAVLAFGVRPFPSRLKHELQKRVSDVAPTLFMFTHFARYLPAQDPVMVRLLTSHYDWYMEGSYSGEEVERISTVILSRSDICRKWREIFRERERKHGQQLTAQGRRAPSKVPAPQDSFDPRGTKEGVEVAQDVVHERSVSVDTALPSQGLTEGGATNTQDETLRVFGRRRNRRKQQAVGRTREKQNSV